MSAKVIPLRKAPAPYPTMPPDGVHVVRRHATVGFTHQISIVRNGRMRTVFLSSDELEWLAAALAKVTTKEGGHG